MIAANTKSKATATRTGRIPYDEFLKTYRNGQHLEWVQGKIVPMSPVTRDHEDIRGFLLALLREWVSLHDLGAVSSEPYNMKIGYGLPGRSPDILFVAKANLARMTEQYLDGPADLVVEIVSAGSRRRDRVLKFQEYERGGVREYWILEPVTKSAEFYVRDANGKYQPVLPDAAGIYTSTILSGLWLQTSWLRQRPLPGLLDILRAWKIV